MYANSEQLKLKRLVSTMINCMIAGVGGQGTVLASKLIASAALKKGAEVRTTETIGMAQRGGSVFSHIRIAAPDENAEINSPLVPKGSCDIIIGFEPAEAVRIAPYLKKDGFMLVSDVGIKPVTLGKSDYDVKIMLEWLEKNIKNLRIVEGNKLREALGSTKVLNVALLGALLGFVDIFPFTASDMEEVIKEKLPHKFTEMNIDALKVGKNYEQS